MFANQLIDHLEYFFGFFGVAYMFEQFFECAFAVKFFKFGFSCFYLSFFSFFFGFERLFLFLFSALLSGGENFTFVELLKSLLELFSSAKLGFDEEAIYQAFRVMSIKAFTFQINH